MIKFFLVLTCILAALTAKAQNIHYEDLTEKVSSVPLDTGVPYRKYVLYSVYVPEIKKDEILYITSEFEATNDNDVNLMIASEIKLCSASWDTVGIILDPNNGFNISPLMHHGVTSRARIYKATQDYYNKYVNVIIWTASSAAKDYHRLKIEPTYGHLDVTIFGQ